MELCWNCHHQLCPTEVEWAKLVGPGVSQSCALSIPAVVSTSRLVWSPAGSGDSL